MVRTSVALPPPWHRRRVSLGVLILAWGVQAIVTQSLLLREALVLMFGSELAWGIVLFAWLFGVAVGATAAGWVAPRLRRPDVALVIVLMALSAAACAELWVFRGARGWLGVASGELLPLPTTALAAMTFVSPTSALVGAAFPLACCIATGPADSASGGGTSGGGASAGVGPLGGVYALESLGSLIGGAAFSFWAVERLAPIQTAMLCAVLTSAASAAFLATAPVKRGSIAGLVTLAVAALLLSVWAGDALDRRLVLRRWRNIAPGYELRAEAESKHQSLAIGERGGQYTLYCDGHVAVDFPDPYTSVPLAHFWMCQHPRPKQVLVLGGAAQGLLAEILRHPVEHVDLVEPDPRQIELIESFLADTDRRALKDARVTVHPVDARYFIKTQRRRFDLVIARLPEPTSALRARFYTDEFYRELRRAMSARSVLCMTAAASPADLPAARADYLASIRATLRHHFPDILIGWGDPAQVLAATGPGLVSTEPAELMRRYADRGVRSEWFDPLWFEGSTDWLDPDKLQARAAQLDAAAHVELRTDLRPAIYMQRLAIWERMTGGQAGGVIEWLRSVSWLELASALAAIGALTMGVYWARGRLQHGPALTDGKPADRNPWASGAIVLSVGTTGFATMALSIVWLFAFQNLYGYVYQRIGWIIALFMAGLAIGCWLAGRQSKRIATSGRARGADPTSDATSDLARSAATLSSYLWRRLVAVDVLLALLAFAVPFILPALGDLQDARLAFILVEWAVSIMVALTGVLGGAAFALAGGLQLATTGRPGTAAGSVVGADHAGACLGALLTGILLVPVLGTSAAAYLLVGIKLGSAMLLLITGKPSRAV